MLKVTLIVVGKLKEKYLKDAALEYGKRLSSLCTLKTIELEPLRLPDNPNPTQINMVLDAEADKITANIPNGSFIIPLCIEGTQLDSTELSRKLNDIGISGAKSVCFIIGSSYGLSDKIKASANLKLSMSKMTFPHQFARIMLLEQLYRAFKISQGGTYHK